MSDLRSDLTRASMRPGRRSALASALLAGLLAAHCARGEAPVATIHVSSATSGSSLSAELVQGEMTFRDGEYVVALRGVATPVRSVGTAQNLVRARDVHGVFEPSGGELRSRSGVTLRFDPPLVLTEGRLEIELLNRKTPKVSSGHPGSGVSD
jgi:hypothetical protein